jgi:hypothetical protein
MILKWENKPLPMFVLQLKKTLSPGGTTSDSGTFVKNIPENL